MITFFVGTPGSGKSYEAVKKIVDNLRLGRVVCTNIEGMDNQKCQEYLKNLLDLDDYSFRQRFRFLSAADVMRFWQTEKIINLTHRFDSEKDAFEDVLSESEELICPAGALIVIDEVHKHFNSRDWQKDSNKQLGDWASTHRHHGYDLVLITQNIDKVDKQVRTLTEWCYFFRKVNFLGSLVSKKYMCYAYSGDEHDGKPLSTSTRNYQPEYFPCYKSYSTADAKEVGFMSHVNILKHPIFYAIPVLLVFTLFMFFKKSSFASGDFLGNKKMAERNKAAVAAVAPSAPAPAPASAVLPPRSSAARVPIPVFPEVKISLPAGYDRYNVSGYIDVGGITYLHLNGVSVRLPNKAVVEYNREMGFVVAAVSVFGPPVSKSAPASSGIPAVSSPEVIVSKASEPSHPISTFPW